MSENSLQLHSLEMLKRDSQQIYLALYALDDHIRFQIPSRLIFYLESLLENGRITVNSISSYASNVARAIAYSYLRVNDSKLRVSLFFPNMSTRDLHVFEVLRKDLLEIFPPEPLAQYSLPQWPNYRGIVTLDRRMQGVASNHPLPISSGLNDCCLAIPNRDFELLSAPIHFGDFILDSSGKVTGIQCTTEVIDKIFGVWEGPIELRELTFSKAFTFEKREKNNEHALWLFRRYELITINDLLKSLSNQ